MTMRCQNVPRDFTTSARPASAWRGLYRQSSVLVLLLSVTGCGQPQLGKAEESDYRLVMQLNAALASRQGDLLQTTATRLKERRDQGNIPDSVYDKLSGMIELAESGDWQTAQHQCLAFMKGQHGNPEFARQ